MDAWELVAAAVWSIAMYVLGYLDGRTSKAIEEASKAREQGGGSS